MFVPILSVAQIEVDAEKTGEVTSDDADAGPLADSTEKLAEDAGASAGEDAAAETSSSTPPPVVATAAPPAPPSPPEERPSPAPAEGGPRRMLFLLGPGFGFGFFYPRHVNSYMEDWQSSQADIVVEESGFTGMVLNFVPRLAFCFAPIEYVQIQGLGEVGWGPKVISVIGGESKSFHFLRFSAGATLNGHIPLRGGKNSLFLGGGVLYHWMRFEDYRADTLGYRALIGFRFFKRRFVPEIFVAFDYARAGTGEQRATREVFNPDGSVSYEGGGEMELDYTGVTIGGNFYFQLTGG